MPSGHAIIKDKEFWRVNPRPPTVSTKQWMTADSRKGRLQLLNDYRRPRLLRTTDDWQEMQTFLMEEHAPFLAPIGHEFPWVGPKVPSSTGPPQAGMPVMKPAVQAATSAEVPAMPELEGQESGQLRVKLLTSRGFMPVRATEQSAGLDLFASEKVTISCNQRKLIGTTVASRLDCQKVRTDVLPQGQV